MDHLTKVIVTVTPNTVNVSVLFFNLDAEAANSIMYYYYVYSWNESIGNAAATVLFFGQQESFDK